MLSNDLRALVQNLQAYISSSSVTEEGLIASHKLSQLEEFVKIYTDFNENQDQNFSDLHSRLIDLHKFLENDCVFNFELIKIVEGLLETLTECLSDYSPTSVESDNSEEQPNNEETIQIFYLTDELVSFIENSLNEAAKTNSLPKNKAKLIKVIKSRITDTKDKKSTNSYIKDLLHKEEVVSEIVGQVLQSLEQRNRIFILDDNKVKYMN